MAFLFSEKGDRMKIKFPKLSTPNLKLPKASNSKSKVSELFKGSNGRKLDSGGMMNNIKSQIPDPIKKFVPNINSGKSNTIDIAKSVKDSTFDIDGMLSKNTNMNEITKSFSSDLSFDIGSGNSFIPSDVLSETIDLS